MLGFNADLAPVADVWSNPDNTVIGDRAYSDDFAQAAELIPEAVRGFHSGGVATTLKHFPGHGDALADSHDGAVYVSKPLEQLRREELLPFRAGIASGSDMVMIGHLILTEIDAAQPAPFSYRIVTELLREELGFQGVVITDGLQMKALTDSYTSGEIARRAVSAGVDILLCPSNPQAAVSALEEAVALGEISEERINQSVRRILAMKVNRGVLKLEGRESPAVRTPASGGKRMNEQTDLIQYTKKRSLCRRLLPLLLAMGLLLVGCSGGTEPSEPSSDTGSSTASASSTPAASAPEPEPEPETLEQELLKKRGVAFDQSDYKTFTGAEGVLSLQTVFSDLNPKKAGGNLSSVFLSGGKIYQYRCDATLPGGQNCREVGTLPLAEQPVYLQANDFNGADLEVVYRGGKRYSVKSASNNGPYTATESKYLHPVLTHAWRYSADGKTLTEDVGLRDRAQRIVHVGGSYLLIADGKLEAAAERQLPSENFEGIYFDDDEDGYIVYEVADEAVGDGEKAVAILNGNILATDQAFYQIMYDDISENDLSYEEKTTNADGTPAAYLPKFGGGNRYRLVKLELLSRYYSDVLTIAHDYIITADYKLLPATEAIGEDYESGYIAYPPDVMEKLLALDGY